jgi:FkbM family methyltransferase
MNLLISSLKRAAPAVIAAKKGDSFPVLSGPLRGVRLPKSVAAQNMGMIFGRYELAVVKKIRSLAGSIKVAYDIGSHIGYMAVALCHCGRAGRVYAFEPVASNAMLIRALAALNQLTSRIVVVQKAVAHQNESQRMHTWKASSMFFIDTARDGQPVNPADAFTVDACTLDHFVFEDSRLPPDFIKLDVEGAEDLVLQGASRTIREFSPRILIEIHGPANADKTWSRLEPFQYEWRHIAENGEESRIERKDDLPRLFSEDSWTAHFFLTRR